jgi:two-component sensor histidine kinase
VAHSLLAELGWRDVSLRDVVQRQIIRYTTDGVELEGPDIPIPAVIVQPLALVFHELVSNAAIHGALSRPDGRLSLSWDKTDGHGGFRMMEYGVRPPETALHVRFGTIMVRAVVEKQLSGRLHRDWDDAGLAIAIEVPRCPESLDRPLNVVPLVRCIRNAQVPRRWQPKFLRLKVRNNDFSALQGA